MKIFKVCILFAIFLVFEIKACMQTPLVSETPDIPIGSPGTSLPCQTCTIQNDSPMPGTLTQEFGVDDNGCRTILLTCTKPPLNLIELIDGLDQRDAGNSPYPNPRMLSCNAQGQTLIGFTPVTRAICSDGIASTPNE